MLREGLQYLLGLAGFELRYRGIEARLLEQFRARQVDEQWRFLDSFRIGTVLDVGANTGQFASFIAARLPDARIVSFEPLPDAFAELSGVLAGHPRAELHACALGSRRERSVIHRSSFSPSSSMLAMTEEHVREWPASEGGESIEIDVDTLDAVLASASWRPDHDLLLKIDVQGHELEVLAGAIATLEHVCMALIEVSFVEYYDGQPLFDEVNDRMRELGFRFAGTAEQFRSRRDGRPNFADALFVRASEGTRE